MDHGFSFMSMQEGAFVDTVKLCMEGFNPEIVVYVPDADGKLPEAFSAGAGAHRCILRVGEAHLNGAPSWPEFAPIWQGRESTRAELVEVTADGMQRVVASQKVTVGEADTAISLRLKLSEAKAKLLALLLAGEPLPPAEVVGPNASEEVPSQINLEWDEVNVDRFVRAHYLPPRDPAQVLDPNSGEGYLIECMEQYLEFRARILNEGKTVCENQVGPYAADTHWYSNVGGSILRMGDSDIHMPAKAADRKRPAVIPGAALGTRKKLRMNEPLIGPNAELYCSGALASSWIGVEGPYVKQFEKQLARICGCAAACAVQSGTAALYGAMKALGVSDPSHHVLVPSFTCAACADAVVHAGGRPIPIDCDIDSWGVSAEAVRRSLASNKNVVGVVVAPCYGVPARDFYEVFMLCKERGLWLCEDACESYGAMQSIPGTDGQRSKVRVGSLA